MIRSAAILFTSALFLGAMTASAGGGHHGRDLAQHIFEQADANGDGVLTAGEYEEANLQRYGVSFSQSDTDGNGETTLGEYLELYDKHHAPVDQKSA